MQDEYTTPPLPPRRSRSLRGVLLLFIVAFAAGAALVGWLAWDGRLAMLLPPEQAAAPRLAEIAAPAAPDGSRTSPPVPGQAAGAALAPPPSLGSVETRLALLEDRLSRIDLQAEAASGEAARAEGLLVAFAARRMIDRGAPLGYLEHQLRLRYADAQPNAVQIIIAAATQPVTLDDLVGKLTATGPALAQAERADDAWGKVRRELAGLFIVRRDSPTGVSPQDRLARAKLLLAVGKVDEAITEVERLPGASAASSWIESARRYATVQRALDLIETTAMLEPRRLQDGEGRKVDQPSSLAPPQAKPADAASDAPAASGDSSV